MKKILSIIIIIFGTCLLIYGTFNIYKWIMDSNKLNKLTKDINKQIEIKEINDGDILDNKNISKSDPYWDYIKMDLMDVDFSKLKKINPDTIGFIKVYGTNINYPFVKTKDNSFYLTHAFDKSYNGGGWVFMDYRNNFYDQNIILYAHGRQNQTMFGSLKNVLKSKWQNNKDNHIIKISTENENTLWQVFSVYKIKNTNDYLKINTDKEFLDKLQKRSAYKFETSVSENDQILTLSTCYNNNEKMVMHAKLIKYSKKGRVK